MAARRNAGDDISEASYRSGDSDDSAEPFDYLPEYVPNR